MRSGRPKSSSCRRLLKISASNSQRFLIRRLNTTVSWTSRTSRLPRALARSRWSSREVLMKTRMPSRTPASSATGIERAFQPRAASPSAIWSAPITVDPFS